MELDYIQNGLADFGKLVSDIKALKGGFEYSKLKAQYDPNLHAVVTDRTKSGRPDREINVGADEKPEKEYIPVARLPIPMQKKIVRMRATFLCGNPIELDATTKEKSVEANLLEVIKKTWEDNKLDYKSKQLAKLMMAETEVAEIWYEEDTDTDYWDDTPNSGMTKRLRCRIIANKYGDTLHPVFDKFGDMVAFGRGWEEKTSDGKTIEHFDLYTADATYESAREGTVLTVATTPNLVGKIPVIYYAQEQPEWYDVQLLISQYETSLSDHTDTNAYSVDPTTVVEGQVLGYAKKGQKGRVLEVEPGGKVSLLAWQQATASLELEQKNLRGHILNDTSTPDISFEEMKGLGNFSGIALKMLFLDAHMAAADKEEIFGEAIQRRINYLKAAHAVINAAMKPALPLSIKPKFTYFLPKNDLEEVQMLTTAVSGETPILSQQTAVALNPLVEDKQAEQELLKEAKEEADAQANSAAGLDRVMKAVA